MVNRQNQQLKSMWIFANTIGAGLGAPMAFKLSDYFVPRELFIINQVVFCLIFGFIMGVAQWLVLRQWIRTNLLWILVTTVSWSIGFYTHFLIWQTVGFSLVMIINFPLIFPIVFAISSLVWGFLVGALQWLILVFQVRKAYRWLLVNIWAVSVSFSIGGYGIFFFANDLATNFFIGLMGLIYGCITGPVLVRLKVLENPHTINFFTAIKEKKRFFGAVGLLLGLASIQVFYPIFFACSGRQSQVISNLNPALVKTLINASCGLFSNCGCFINGQAIPVERSSLKTFTFQGEESDIAFSPDGKLFATNIVAPDRQGDILILWDWISKQPIRRFNTNIIYNIGFSPNGQILATLEGEWLSIKEKNSRVMRQFNSINLWNVKTGKLQKNLPVGQSNIAFSPDSQTLATLNPEQSAVYLWDVKAGTVRQQFSAENVNNLAFTHNGQFLLVEAGNTLQVRKAATGEIHHNVTLDNSFTFTSLAVSSDSEFFAISDGFLSGVIKIWHLPTGKLLQTLSPGRSEGVADIAISPDGNTLASGSRQKNTTDTAQLPIRLWDIKTGSLRCLLSEDLSVNSLAFSPDGKTLAVAGQHSVKILAIPIDCQDKNDTVTK